MELRFNDFIKQGIYLKSWSPKTVRTYRQGLNAFEQNLRQLAGGAGIEPAQPDLESSSPGLGTWPPTKTQLDAFVIWMRQRGLTAGGCNMYIRTVNSYLTWLHEEGEIPQPLKIKLLPDPKKPLRGFSDAEIRLLLLYRPKGLFDLRTLTLVHTLLDTGIRIEEALTLRTADVDLDALTLKVLGKGNKLRVVPFSLELRKMLWRYREAKRKKEISEKGFLFCAHSGNRLSYRNAYRDLKTLCKKAGVEGEHVHPHAMRHCFAVNFIRRGGDIFRLSRCLGHSSISTTQLYLRSMGVEQIAEGHHSPLERY